MAGSKMDQDGLKISQDGAKMSQDGHFNFVINFNENNEASSPNYLHPEEPVHLIINIIKIILKLKNIYNNDLKRTKQLPNSKIKILVGRSPGR